VNLGTDSLLSKHVPVLNKKIMAKFTEAQAVYRLYDKSDRNELTSFGIQ
jgi:hypothetical protein